MSEFGILSHAFVSDMWLCMHVILCNKVSYIVCSMESREVEVVVKYGGY